VVGPCSRGRAHSAPDRPRRLLLLGLGNDLLTDDAIGLRVVDAARERLKDCPNIAVAGSTEMGLPLLDFVVGFEDLLLVDAIQTGKVLPGFVHELEVTDLKALPIGSPHFVGVGEVLALARALELDVPTYVKILAIEVEDPFTVSQKLTPVLEARFPDLLARVIAEARAISSASAS
jgi:hydrogenase maturation protease